MDGATCVCRNLGSGKNRVCSKDNKILVGGE